MPTEYYNGNELEREHLGHVQNGFLLLGAISARQVRVKNMTCDLDPSDLIYPSVQNCFGEYSSKTEERQPYGPMVSAEGSDVKFKFSTAKDLGCRIGCSTTGWLATYQVRPFRGALACSLRVPASSTLPCACQPAARCLARASQQHATLRMPASSTLPRASGAKSFLRAEARAGTGRRL